MFAECCVFDKQSQRPGHCDPRMLSYACSHTPGCTFSRSYGAMLPSSFTRVLSSALGFSPCLPVSDYGTVLSQLKLRGFSWKRGISDFVLKELVSVLGIKKRGFAYASCLPPFPGTTNARYTYPSPSPHRTAIKCWNINQLPIDYAFPPRLRDRLTLRR